MNELEKAEAKMKAAERVLWEAQDVLANSISNADAAKEKLMKAQKAWRAMQEKQE